MNDKHLVVHTYLDLRETKEKNRPVWRTIVTEYPGWVIAHAKMREAFSNYFHSFASRICGASFNHDCAYIETEGGGKEIWSITGVEGDNNEYALAP